ncbi:efflux RND transporter permease subunit, partial [Candidatus Kaiserbacteria bacterium]|nr:efflux RND transporter permease subunit [Candidatus Kaiserbacteria bacterium]
MWHFFITNSKFAYLFLVALVAIGSYSLVTIPKESAPEVVIPIGMVTTVLPGAPAADVESLVTNEYERSFVSLENVKKITSVSVESISTVVVEFEASADLDKSIQKLKDQVDTVKPNLPQDAEDPVVSEMDFVDQPVLTTSVAGDMSDMELSELADAVERDLESIPGVSRVDVSGVRNRALTVIVNQADLQRFNLSLSEITNAIRNANLTFPIGQIENDGVSYNVAFEGDITDAEQLRNIGVTIRGGQPVFLKDVAVVEDGLTDARTLSRLSVAGAPSKNAMTLNVYKQSGGNIVTITKAVNNRLTELQQPGELLDGISVETVLDAGQQINDDLVRLSSSGLQTVILVVLLLVVAIGW